METLSDNHNTLLHRRDVTVVITAQTNPGVAAVATQLAEHFKSTADAVAIKMMHGSYGKQELTVTASIYDSAASKLRIEQKPKKKKEGAK